MNREICFRGKSVKSGKWLYGYLGEIKSKILQTTYVEKVIFSNLNWFNTDNFGYVVADCTVDKDTIGQFTGLYDKNQKPIFEGDIVRFYELETTDFDLYQEQRAWFKETEGVVIYEEGMVCIKSEDIPQKYPLSQSGFHSLEEAVEAISGMDLGENDVDSKGNRIDEHLVGIEVVGNIHDNMDLLED